MDDGSDDEGLTIEVPPSLPPLPNTTGTFAPMTANVSPGAQRHLWTGPFATTRQTAEDADATMGTASPVPFDPAHQRLSSAPTLPAAPKYKGSTMKDMREFMRQYQTYVHELSAFSTPFHRPYVMPVSGCIEERTCRLICMYELQKDPNQVDEDEWIAYFRRALEPEHEDYTAIDAAMKQLRMKTSLPDAMSRMGQLRADMHRILDEYSMEAILIQKEQKKLVRYLVSALEPEDFRVEINRRLELSQNKELKKDVVRCYSWITDQLRAYLVWHPSAPHVSKAHAKATKTTAETPPQSSTPGSNNRGGRGNDSANGNDRYRSRQQQGHQGTPAEQQDAGARSGAQHHPNAPRPCLKCNSTEHKVRQCPHVKPDEVEGLIAAWRDRTVPPTQQMRQIATASLDSKLGASSQSEIDTGTTSATIGSVHIGKALLDSGADASLVSRGVVDALAASGAFVSICTVPVPISLSPLGGAAISADRKIRFDEVTLDTAAGPLVLRGLECWVHEDDATLALTLGRPVMNSLGYSTVSLLTAARGRSEDYCVDECGSPIPATTTSPFIRMARLAAESLDQEAPNGADDAADELVGLPDPAAQMDQTVLDVLEIKIAEAVSNGLSEEDAIVLRELLMRYADVFRLSFGNDPPVRVPPLKVRLKPDAVPVKAKSRRYPPAHKLYLDRHVQELIDHGLLRVNHRSRWASAPRIVSKATPGEYRMTVDTRAVNAATEPMPWPMPDLEADLGKVVGATAFFTLDWWRGYWQLPLDEESQELFTIITHNGMYTPTRVLMGSSDAVAYCQGVVETVFAPLLHNEMLAWLDDILGYAQDHAALLQVLEHVLALCQEYGLKIHPGKCCFFTKEAQWCGKMISADGVRHCTERINGLVDMKPPRTAAELQQFVCAVNWMRSSIPNFSALITPLHELLELAMSVAKSRKKNRLQHVELAAIGWSQEHERVLQDVKNALVAMVPLAHPREDMEVCVFADASDEHWGAVVTQIPSEDVSRPLSEQRHEPLAFLSGSFQGSSRRWPIIDKEAFAIVATCKRLMYLLLRPRGFRIFTDHRNLQYIFAPLATNSTMPKFQADRLQRWAMTLTMFQYVIEHVRGDDNVWGDLLSRWGSNAAVATVRTASLVVTERVSPLQEQDFVWPNHSEIARIQRDALSETDLAHGIRWDDATSVFKSRTNRIWIPDTAVALKTRLCVIAHAGAMGHRGCETTFRALADVFEWTAMRDDVNTFVRGCLHCLSVGDTTVPRPYGPALHATKPNEILHFDFLSLPESENGSKYVLVLKDDMSGFVELVECMAATAEEACDALLAWFKRFGVVRQWVSDRGTHFKNDLMDQLRKRMSGAHHFATAYCPWANGTVEVVNRVLLHCLRSLLSEMKLKIGQWPGVLPLVQAALNHAPSDRLGGVAPITAFASLPATTPLSTIIHPTTKRVTNVQWVYGAQRENVKVTQDALEGMHKALSTVAEKKRSQARTRRARKPGVSMPNFAEGDFVLAAQVYSRTNKLAVQWKGPKRITKALSDYVYEVQDIIEPFAVTVHHASRLQYYADAQRDVTEDFVAQALHGEGGHLVSKVLRCRKGPNSHAWELQIEWIGLDPLEASWEPATIMNEDVPDMVKSFVESHPDDPAVQAMWKSLTKTRTHHRKGKKGGGK